MTALCLVTHLMNISIVAVEVGNPHVASELSTETISIYAYSALRD